MITIQKIGSNYNVGVLELVGLSTDTKPTEQIDGTNITNGSSIFEMDTGKVFMYDAQNKTWRSI